MSKRSRYLIFIFVSFFLILFLTPSIRWYFFFSEQDKIEASLRPEQIKEEVSKKVDATINDLKEGKNLENYKEELRIIKNEFLKEVKKINKVLTPDSKIKLKKDYTYKEMYDLLMEKRKKEKYVNSFFRSVLDDYYKKYYENKKKVKDGIIKLGLDLQGGAYAVVTVNFNHPSLKDRYKDGNIPKKDKEEMIDSAMIKIENRINKWGVSETSIQKLRDQDKIIINLPGVKGTSELREIIETVGVLEFKLVSKEGTEALANVIAQAEGEGRRVFDSTGKLLPEFLAVLPPDTEALIKSNRDKWGVESENKRLIVVEKESLLGENVKIQSATVQQDGLGRNVINFVLEGDAAKKWATVTGNNVGREIAIILDNVVLENPVVQEKIPNGRSQITLGNAPIEHLQNLALILKSGSLNVPLEISEENSVGASLGQDTIEEGLWACLWGIVAVFLFMIIYYNVGGVIADVAVVLNLLFLLGGLAMFKGTLTLPGIAGIVLTVGMAVDANVIIFERIKEEFRAGKTFKTALTLGFDKAFWTIMDSNITTFAAGIGLSIFGTGPIKGFAVTLCLGIVSSLFTSLFVSRLLFDSLLSKIDLKTLRVLSLLKAK